MFSLMISIVGEQPAPILVPIYELKPNYTILLSTSRTNDVAERLLSILGDENFHGKIFEIEPYNVNNNAKSLRKELLDFLREHNELDVLYNITGGTKLMMLSILQVANEQRFAGKLCYYRTEHSHGILYIYDSKSFELNRELKVKRFLTIDEYLKAYLGSYTEQGTESQTSGGSFERAVADALSSQVDEIKLGIKKGGALDIDLVVRCGNQIGIIEVKTGKKAQKKEGIDQLSTAGAREYLGIYVKKFLVVDTSWERLTNLKDLAEAHKIKVIELPSYSVNGELSKSDKEYLVRTVQQSLFCHIGGQDVNP